MDCEQTAEAAATIVVARIAETLKSMAEELANEKARRARLEVELQQLESDHMHLDNRVAILEDKGL